jgi:omega-amidase
MNKKLHVTIVQSNLFWENIPKNIQQFQRKLARIKKGETDVIVLPEMFSTGFSMRPDLFAEKPEGSTMQWMAYTAEKMNAVVCGSLMIREGKKFFNRFIWMRPDGTYAQYDKRHLFRMGNEGETYSSGKERIIVEHKGWKICPQICYDLRFPVFSRNGINKRKKIDAYDFDLLLYVANWPAVRSFAWETLLPARAIENQCYVVGVNRIGKDGNGVNHIGCSTLLNPLGEKLYRSASHNIHTLALDAGYLVELRKKFPVLMDADAFILK